MRGSIIKRTRADGKAVYCLKWRTPDGKQHWKTLERCRKEDAERALDEIIRRIHLGLAYQPEPESWGTVADRFLEAYEQRARPASVARLRLSLRHLEHLRDVPLELVRAGEIEREVTAIARRAPRTAQLVLATAKTVLRSARDRGQLVDEAIFPLRPPRVERAEMRFLSWPEVEELAAETIEPYGLLVQFACLSGLRQGELFALRDRALELEAGVVRVEASAYQGELAPVKTTAGRRRVALSPEGVRLLRLALLARPGRQANALGLVFPTPHGGVWRKDNFMARVFRPAVKRAKLEPLRFHDLRHTYAALMVAAGAHPKLLQAQMGHSSITVTLNTYGHLFPDAFADVGAQLDALVLGQSSTAAEEAR